MIKGKKAPVCFTGFKVLLCVQLPCVTTCRLRARFHPHPSMSPSFFLNFPFCLPGILKLFCYNSQETFWVCDIEVELICILKRKKKIPNQPPSEMIGLLNLEPTLIKYLESCCFPTSLPYPSGLHILRSQKENVSLLSVCPKVFQSLASK